jgi:hypothetical protein
VSFRRFALMAVLFAFGGCGFQQSPAFDRVAIRGTVTLDSQPLSDAWIQFIPDAQVQGPKVLVPIREGVFEASAEHGPVAGSHRIEVMLTHNEEPAHDDEEAWQKMRGERVSRKRPAQLPAIYNESSLLSAIIEPAHSGNIQSLTFDLKSR